MDQPGQLRLDVGDCLLDVREVLAAGATLGRMVNSANRNPPTGGEYVRQSGIEPSSGNCGVASPPQSW